MCRSEKHDIFTKDMEYHIHYILFVLLSTGNLFSFHYKCNTLKRKFSLPIAQGY